jgi:hypothetical protein
MMADGRVKSLKFVQFQVLPETDTWHPETWALDEDGQIWVMSLDSERGWQKIDQRVSVVDAAPEYGKG